MSIPIISPIELNPAQSAMKLLPAPEQPDPEQSDPEQPYTEEGQAEPEEPDYTVQEIEPPPAFIASPALMALNEIEQALEVQARHDFGWWRKRLNLIREAMKPPRPTNVST